MKTTSPSLDNVRGIKPKRMGSKKHRIMKTAQFVPGHWFVVTDETDCVSTAGKKILAELEDDEFIDCNTEGNARLIAAAPEMLEALEMLVGWEETGSPLSDVCFSQARAAIAKAKGGIA